MLLFFLKKVMCLVFPFFLTLVLFSIALLGFFLGLLFFLVDKGFRVGTFFLLFFGIICFLLVIQSYNAELKLEQWSYVELTIVSHYPSYSTYYFDVYRRSKYDGHKVFLSNGDSTIFKEFDNVKIFNGATVVRVECVVSCVSVPNGWFGYYLGSIEDDSKLEEFIELNVR